MLSVLIRKRLLKKNFYDNVIFYNVGKKLRKNIIKTHTNSDIENMIKRYPKIKQNRTYLKIVPFNYIKNNYKIYNKQI